MSFKYLTPMFGLQLLGILLRTHKINICQISILYFNKTLLNKPTKNRVVQF